uniref:Phorbol-ester/DAG-type domain-containing protein n=1 Tax=Brugia pahangi TaxID=6280 RepID=A0A0N4T3R0_BRUPA
LFDTSSSQESSDVFISPYSVFSSKSSKRWPTVIDGTNRGGRSRRYSATEGEDKYWRQSPNMDKILCSGRSRKILKEYGENNHFAMTLIEKQNQLDMLKVLDLLEQMRHNWNYEKIRAEAMEDELDQGNKEKDGLRKEIRMYREQLRDARKQIAALMSDKKSMEYDIGEWERKFELVTDLLKDQSHLSMEDRQKLFANGSILNKKPTKLQETRDTHLSFSHCSSDEGNIDYDKTADISDNSSDETDESRLRNGKVYRRRVMTIYFDSISVVELIGEYFKFCSFLKFRSRSMVSLTAKRISAVASKRPKKSMLIDTVEEEVETPSKRSKNGTEIMIPMNTGNNNSPTTKIAVKRSMNNRSLSNILNKSEETMTQPTNTLTPRCGTSSTDLLVFLFLHLKLYPMGHAFCIFIERHVFCDVTFMGIICAKIYVNKVVDLWFQAQQRLYWRTPLSGTKTWTRGASISTRPHTYTNHSSILGDHCEVCNGWIGIVGKQAYKCCDCGLHIHKSCIHNAPVPCVPRTPTSRTPSKQRPRLKDLCPSTQPMIPPILIHCILALEKNRLCSEGIYRIPGDDTQVQKLLNEFQHGRSVPKLDYQDTETITSCIKQFLNKLRDPVIPSTSWEEFVNAARTDDIEALNNGIMDLPYPNRDTLAFLCAHFQKICDNCVQNKMPRNVLARCVAAIVVGPAPPHVGKDDEEKKQITVMSALLKMPPDYWPKFYNFDRGIPLINSPKCTLNDNRKLGKIPYKNPNRSILGPVETPPSGQKANFQLKTQVYMLMSIIIRHKSKHFGDNNLATEYVMNDNICRDRSRIVLNEYAETVGIAKFLVEGQSTCNFKSMPCNSLPKMKKSFIIFLSGTKFLHLLDIMENMRQNWDTEKLRADTLQEQMNTREHDYSGLQQENRMYKEQLRDARAQIATLMSDKQNLERDMVELERKFALVNELLKNDQSLLKEEDRQKLSFLNYKSSFHEPLMRERQAHHILHGVSRTLSHGEDTDYDKTADSMDISYDDSDESHLRNGKVYRRSRSLAVLPSTHSSAATVKRSKESKRMNIVEEEIVSSINLQKSFCIEMMLYYSLLCCLSRYL